jgi:ankyrin repeat protein
MSELNPVTAQQLFQVLELTVSDGPKELKKRALEFKQLWDNASPEVRRAQNAAGQTILHLMVIYGFEMLIPDILKEIPALALRHAKNNNECPIHIAIANHQIAVAKLLFEVPGVANLRNSKNQTALHYAARFGSQEMVLLCCQKRVGHIDEKDRLGNTALALAQAENTPDVEAVLIAQGADGNVVSDL